MELDRTRRPGVAVWRKDKNFSASINDAQDVWHDFVTNHNGGVIDLVVKVLGCDRKAAFDWLAAYAGDSLDDRGSRRTYARQMQAARPKAEALVRWKMETLKRLRAQRKRAAADFPQCCSLRTLACLRAVRRLWRRSLRAGDMKKECARLIFVSPNRVAVVTFITPVRRNIKSNLPRLT